MLIRDTEKLASLAKTKAKESYYDRLRRWEYDKVHNAIYITDDEINPGNWEYQKGRELTTPEFEKRLLKIFPGAKFATYKTNPTKRCVYRVLPDGEAQHLVTYESAVMPESSVHKITYEDILDLDPSKDPDALGHLDRKDLPKAEWDGKQWVFDRSKPLPGQKRVKLGTTEIIRGWRTVLLRLIHLGVITLDAAEREFGVPSGSKRWAYHTKKHASLASPF